MGRLDYLKQNESVNSVRSYTSALKKFFETIYGERDGLEELAERYFTEQRNYEEDVQAFAVAVKDSAPMTRRLSISAVRILLLENHVELPQLFWRRLRGRIKGARAITDDKVPDNETLRKVMMHLPIQGKALYLTLASSGMRIGEALRLQPEDLDLESDPVKVNIRGEYTKTGNKRVTFISREAKEAVTEWLKVRSDYLKAAVGKSKARPQYKKEFKGKSLDDERLFPFSEVNARIIWRNALAKSGNGKQDPRTNITLMHPHVLRKFFRSQMGTIIPIDVAEAIMGHEGYLTEVYRKYPDPEKTLAEFYLKGEHVLLAFTEAGEVSKLRQEIEERNRQLQTLVNGLTAENMELKARLSRVELEHVAMKRKIEAELADLKKMLQNE